ncbi:protein FAR1-RELATED SEQUENCE 5-like [Panicum virgatum]|uniref:protein FAR1-RELATED SEQUENCE 5-like n=1 Tax=Panicum virgatum TaxID=38727 RepID=UPI0019D53346|nr:protein FAR1-RELATED SEQUENCE 5-like [Panicum virgatum]
MADLENLMEYSEIISKMFADEDEGHQFYNAYALGKGFSVRKSYVEWNRDHTEITLRRYVCSHQGYHEEKYVKKEIKKRRPWDITRVGCRTKLVIALDRNSGQWYVKNFIDEHNHPLAPADLGYLLRSHRSISDAQKAEIVELGVAGIRKHHIFEIMEMQYGRYDKIGYTSRDLYNFCHLYKQEIIAAGDAQTIISHLMERQNRDSDFFFKYMTNGEGHLEGLFWCDTQCLLDYEAFGDVVFDSTYKTNWYNLPLVPFVGVNHHYRTVIFGCGIISHENIESYVWLLKIFTETNVQKHPISVITDGDLAMQRAISVVWPNSPHRFCGWHIEQNLVRNIHDDTVKAEFRIFMYDLCSIEEIERKWQAFFEKYDITEDSWLYQMYEVRATWCAVYHAGNCYLGLRSNQRSESMNSRLQMKLDGKITLLEMVQHYESCLTKVRRIEVDDDANALQSEPFTDPDASILEVNAKKRFTPNVFKTKVQFNMEAAKKCSLVEILDGDDTTEYIVGRSDRDMMYYVKCELTEEANLKEISCSCQLGISVGSILFVHLVSDSNGD